MDGIELFSAVALLDDLLELGLVRGQVGAVIEALAPGVFEVEFCEADGRTFALVPLESARLLRLHYQPVSQAA